MDFGYYGSIILFVIISLLSQSLIKKGHQFDERRGYLQFGKKNNKLNRYYFLLVIIFTIFAVFRKVDIGLGGYDARNYINYFLYCNQSVSAYTEIIIEPLWLLICRAIRLFTSNYHIFFAICYSFIIFSFVIFIKKYCPTGIDYTPFILVLWPYLKDFNTLRSGVAIGIILIALTIIEEKRVLSIILLISTLFVHRMSVLYIPVFVFFYLFKGWRNKLKGYKLISFYAVFIVCSYLISKYLQRYIMRMNILDSKDGYYLRMSIGESILSRWPMFFMQLCLLISLIIFERKVRDSKEINNLRIFFTYDVLMIPASLILGMWRASEYMYLVRIILWGEVIRVATTFVDDKSKKIVKLLAFIVIIAWLIFRIVQEADDIGVIPYIFQLHNSWQGN